MATDKATVDHLLACLKSPRFTAKAMFGEYALYADGKVVALVCDDRLFVKVADETSTLAEGCELAPPYPGAKDHYLVDEAEWSARRELPQMLLSLAKALPVPKSKAKKAAKRKGR